IAPVDPFEQIAHLAARQMDDAANRGGPDEAAPLQALCIERQTHTVVPERLDQRPVASSKHEYVPGKRVPPQPFLDQARQSAHPLAHIGMAAGQPYADIGANRDHRSARSTVRTNRAGAVAAMLTVVPPARSRRIAGLSETTSIGAAGTAAASFSAMIAGTNLASDCWTSRRHL